MDVRCREKLLSSKNVERVNGKRVRKQEAFWKAFMGIELPSWESKVTERERERRRENGLGQRNPLRLYEDSQKPTIFDTPVSWRFVYARVYAKIWWDSLWLNPNALCKSLPTWFLLQPILFPSEFTKSLCFYYIKQKQYLRLWCQLDWSEKQRYCYWCTISLLS